MNLSYYLLANQLKGMSSLSNQENNLKICCIFKEENIDFQKVLQKAWIEYIQEKEK